jgi:chromosome segregation ATPase
VLIAGPARSRAVIHQVHENLNHAIDQAVDDPSALRTQLIDMERQYPERIAQVRGDLAELQEQIRQLDRERAIADKVVALADRDLEQLEPKLTRAASEAVDGASSSSEIRLAAVQFGDRVLSYDRAWNKLNQIRSTRVAYQNRSVDAEHDLVYLQQQAERLGELLVQLEGERAEFQLQLQQLNRQIDAVARNERLIKLLEKRNRTIAECSRYESQSLDQITARLSEVRSRQEAELEVLSSTQRQVDYEDLARAELQAETRTDGQGVNARRHGQSAVLRLESGH